MKIRDNSEQFEKNNEKDIESNRLPNELGESLESTGLSNELGNSSDLERLSEALENSTKSTKLLNTIQEKDREKNESVLSEKLLAKIREDYPGISDEFIAAIRTKDNYKKLDKIVKVDEEEKDFLEPDRIYESGSDKIAMYTDDTGELYRVNDTLLPDKKYEINGFSYLTDKLGRIILAWGLVTNDERESRKPITDSIHDIGRGDEKVTDDKGHILAHQLGGSNGLENMIAQDAHINRGEYNKFEKQLAAEAKAGKEVFVAVQPIYKGDSARPKAIVYTAIIDGKKEMRIFSNGGN